MASHRYRTREPTGKISYQSELSDCDYLPSSDRYEAMTINSHIASSLQPKIGAKHPPPLLKSTSYPHIQTQSHKLASKRPIFQATLTPSTTTGIIPIKNLDTCPRCLCIRNALNPEDEASTWVCPRNCGWGHYDGNCGAKVPLIPKKMSISTPLYSSGFDTTPTSAKSQYGGYVARQDGSDVEHADHCNVDEFGEVEEEGKEKSETLFDFRRFKEKGRRGGRDYRVDGEGDAIMSGT